MKTRTTSDLATIRAILRFPLIRRPLLGGILFVGEGISNGFMVICKDSTPTALALMVVVLALAIYWAFVRFVENRPVSELSLPGMGGEFGTGLMLGFGLYSACILILGLLGYYRIEGLNPWR
jgi:hypothetical protein